jgi:hypothetical protein
MNSSTFGHWRMKDGGMMEGVDEMPINTTFCSAKIPPES